MSQKNMKRIRRPEGRVDAWERAVAASRQKDTDTLTQQRNDKRRRAREAERAAATYRVLTHGALILAILALAVAIAMATKAKGVEDTVPEPADPVEIVPPVAVSTAAVTESEPVPERVIGFEPANYIEDCTITFYCVCKDCCGKDPDDPAYGITASGRPAEPYVSVGVDPEVIPLGSIILMDIGDGRGEQRYRADDTGSGVRGNHIDVCVSSHDEAMQLGRRAASAVWTAPEDNT